jgi:serine protease Do
MKATRYSVAVAGLAIILLVVGLTGPYWASRVAYATESGRAAAAREQLQSATDLSRVFQQVAKAVRPSVVNISSVRRIQPRAQTPTSPSPHMPFREFFGEDFFDRFFQHRTPQRGFEQRGLGTGVIVSEDGYILTNNHVIEGADEVTITLSDDRAYKAEVIGTDDKTDLAVLKIDVSELTEATLGDSDAIEIGDWVLALGNPFGLEQTVTAGIISAKGRAHMGIAEYEDFIQTDAAINPGNSGGPLVNLRGEVIGINTAIASRTGGSMGIGFAIPSSMARTVMDSIVKNGRVERGWLGVAIQNLTDDLADSFGFEGTDGVLIGDVTPDGPADKAGLQQGDIVLTFHDKPTTNVNQLRNLVAATPPGQSVEVAYHRNGKRQTVQVDIGELETQMTVAHGRDANVDLGMTVQTMTPDIARQLGEQEATGVVVTGIEPGGLAATAGVRPKDIIVMVNDAPIKDVADFRAEIDRQHLKKGVRRVIKTHGSRRFVVLKSRS